MSELHFTKLANQAQERYDRLPVEQRRLVDEFVGVVMDLAEAIWSCAYAEINMEDREHYAHLIVVTIDCERLKELGVDVDKDALVDIINASIPDGYDTVDPSYLEFYNTTDARTALLAHGVTIDVFDDNGLHYQMKPGGDIVVVSYSPSAAEGGIEL